MCDWPNSALLSLLQVSPSFSFIAPALKTTFKISSAALLVFWSPVESLKCKSILFCHLE